MLLLIAIGFMCILLVIDTWIFKKGKLWASYFRGLYTLHCNSAFGSTYCRNSQFGTKSVVSKKALQISCATSISSHPAHTLICLDTSSIYFMSASGFLLYRHHQSRSQPPSQCQKGGKSRCPDFRLKNETENISSENMIRSLHAGEKFLNWDFFSESSVKDKAARVMGRNLGSPIASLPF